MVSICKTVGVGEKERLALDIYKMKKLGFQKQIYDKPVISWV